MRPERVDDRDTRHARAGGIEVRVAECDVRELHPAPGEIRPRVGEADPSSHRAREQVVETLPGPRHACGTSIVAEQRALGDRSARGGVAAAGEGRVKAASIRLP
jgi:hypothetical protein